MSVKAMAWAWEQEVGGNEKLVLLALADRSNDAGICWPGVGRLIAKCKATESTIRKCLASLKNKGLILIEERHRADGSRTSNRYYLAFYSGEDSPFCPDEDAHPPSDFHTSPLREIGEAPLRELIPAQGIKIGGASLNRHIEPSNKKKRQQRRIDTPLKERVETLLQDEPFFEDALKDLGRKYPGRSLKPAVVDWEKKKWRDWALENEPKNLKNSMRNWLDRAFGQAEAGRADEERRYYTDEELDAEMRADPIWQAHQNRLNSLPSTSKQRLA